MCYAAEVGTCNGSRSLHRHVAQHCTRGCLRLFEIVYGLGIPDVAVLIVGGFDAAVAACCSVLTALQTRALPAPLPLRPLATPTPHRSRIRGAREHLLL